MAATSFPSASDGLPRLSVATLPISLHNHNPAEQPLSVSPNLVLQHDGLSSSHRHSALMTAVAFSDNTHFVILQCRVIPGSPVSNSIESSL